MLGDVLFFVHAFPFLFNIVITWLWEERPGLCVSRAFVSLFCMFSENAFEIIFFIVLQ